jgi:hypothetical protein
MNMPKIDTGQFDHPAGARLSVVEIAAQLGHNPTVCLDTYAHVMAEERGAEHVSAEQQIVQAQASLAPAEPPDAQLTFEEMEW